MNRKNVRTFVLGVTAGGLVWQSVPACAQTAPAAAPVQYVPVQAVAPAQVPMNQVQPASQMVAANQKSPVQQQLELLYQQDGRELPELNYYNMQQTPAASGTSTQPAPGASGTRQAAPQNQSRNPVNFTHPNQQPMAAPPGGQPLDQAKPASVWSLNATAQQQQQQQQQPAPKKHPMHGLFRKLTGTNKVATTQEPIPPDYSAPPVQNYQPPVQPPMMAPNVVSQQIPQVPVTPPQSMPAQATPPQVPVVQKAAPAAVSPQSRPQVARTAPVTKSAAPVATVPKAAAASKVAATPPAAPVVQLVPLPVLAAEPTPLQVTSGTGSDEPAVEPAAKPEAKKPEPAAVKPEKRVAKAAPAKPAKPSKPETTIQPGTEFPDPFPEEAESDLRVSIKSIQKDEPVAPSKTDVIVEPSQEVEPATTDAAPPAVIAAEDDDAEALGTPGPAANEDPFAVDAKDFVEPITEEPAAPLVIDPTAPSLDAPSALQIPQQENATPISDANSAVEAKPAIESQPVDDRSFSKPVHPLESHEEKVKRIRCRFGMKGLKGFCPVTLREERELVDAKNEYTATYRNQKFHFASENARRQFELEPAKYVPAAYGADVVALNRDKEVVEGTLDFASWFKGRLYLFGSQANYDAFLVDPAHYAAMAE